MSQLANARYAIYFAPEAASPWWDFGSRWLGRDERDNSERMQPLLESIDPGVFSQITAAPRRYGFHATLKAPFRLRGDATPGELLDRVRALALTLGPAELGPLVPRVMSGFTALVPVATSGTVDALAAACVSQLDDLRAALTPEEISTRRAAGLDAREEELLRQFGYPFVFERFRLHFTLTGRVDERTAARVCSAVATQVKLLNHEAPLVVDRLCVFAEAQSGQAMLRIADYPLAFNRG
jgi:putative phosphonate metabolism protein